MAAPWHYSMADSMPAAIAATPIIYAIGRKPAAPYLYGGFLTGRHNPPSAIDNVGRQGFFYYDYVSGGYGQCGRWSPIHCIRVFIVFTLLGLSINN